VESVQTTPFSHIIPLIFIIIIIIISCIKQIILILIKCQTQTSYQSLGFQIWNLNVQVGLHNFIFSNSNQRIGVNVCPHSVDPNPEPSSSNIGYSPPTRSVHYKGNRSGHVPVEEAESCKGEEFLESPTLTTPQRNTPPNLSCHHGWAMGRGRGLSLGGVKNSSLL